MSESYGAHFDGAGVDGFPHIISLYTSEVHGIRLPKDAIFNTSTASFARKFNGENIFALHVGE